jgi:hypothetical protein
LALLLRVEGQSSKPAAGTGGGGAGSKAEPYSRRPLFSRERIAMVDPRWSESVAAAVSNRRFAPWAR